MFKDTQLFEGLALFQRGRRKAGVPLQERCAKCVKTQMMINRYSQLVPKEGKCSSRKIQSPASLVTCDFDTVAVGASILRVESTRNCTHVRSTWFKEWLDKRIKNCAADHRLIALNIDHNFSIRIVSGNFSNSIRASRVISGGHHNATAKVRNCSSDPLIICGDHNNIE